MHEQADLVVAQLHSDVRAVLQIVAAGCGFDAGDVPDGDPPADLCWAPETITGR